MRIIPKPLWLLLIFLWGSNIAFPQTIGRSVVASAAETFTIPNFSINYVLGEVVGDLLPNPGNSLYLTVGFAQSDVEIQQILSLDITKSFVLYPNPTTGNIVKLAFNNLPDGPYQIDIIDPIGRVLQTQTVNYANNNFFYLPLDISQYKGGVYFIRVISPFNFQGKIKLIKL